VCPDDSIEEWKMKTKIENAKGKEVCIFHGADGEFYVRVYGLNNSFKDYAMKFADLWVQVTSNDICFYEAEDGTAWIDHSPEVYGGHP
jgi:hypothetical protein